MKISLILRKLSKVLKDGGEDLAATQTIASLENFRPEQWGLPPFDTDS